MNTERYNLPLFYTTNSSTTRGGRAGCHPDQTLLQLIKIPSATEEISSVKSSAEMFGQNEISGTHGPCCTHMKKKKKKKKKHS